VREERQIRMVKEKRFEKVVEWDEWESSTTEFWLITILFFFLCLILSPLFALIFWYRQLKGHLENREVYWREIKDDAKRGN